VGQDMKNFAQGTQGKSREIVVAESGFGSVEQ